MNILAYVIIVLQMLIGVLYCFFGCKYFRWISGVVGFLIGGIASFIMLLAFGLTLAIILAIVIGIVVGLLAYYFYIIGLFISGVFFGASLSSLLLLIFGASFGAWYSIAAIIALSLAGGILAVVLRKFFIILSTAYTGASMLVSGAFTLIFASVRLAKAGVDGIADLTANVSAAHSVEILISTLVLAVLGIIIQAVKTAPKDRVPNGYHKR